MWEKTTIVSIFVFNTYYKKNYLQSCTGADSFQHVGTHLQKATTFTHFLAPSGRELQPLDLVYQHPMEGRYNP